MRILVATSIHPDFDSRIVKQADTLAGAGHEVNLLAPWKGMACPPHHYNPLFFRRRHGLKGRLCAYLIFLWTAIFSRFDAVHIHDFDMLPFATLIRLITWRKVIYDVHENYAQEVMVRSWIPDLIRWPLSHAVAAVERVCCIFVRNTIVVVPLQEKRFGSWGCNIVMVRNFCSTSLAPESSNDLKVPNSDYFVFNSSGQEVSYGALVYLEASKLLSSRRCNITLAAVERFAGDIKLENSIRQAMAKDAPDYRLLPRLKPHELGLYLSKSVIGVSCMLNTVNRNISIPTKLFEYMAFGIPIVATDVGYQSEIIREAKAGILVPPGDPDALAAAIARIWEDPDLRLRLGAAGRTAFFDHYCWEQEGIKLIEYYKKLSGIHRSGVERASSSSK
jgi:glycosyltransferase involved in cell wall biosynthesis